MASGFAPNRPKITPVSRRGSVCATLPVSVLKVTSKPAPTNCFQGIETSVVSKSLSGSGMITCIAIASPSWLFRPELQSSATVLLPALPPMLLQSVHGVLLDESVIFWSAFVNGELPHEKYFIHNRFAVKC